MNRYFRGIRSRFLVPVLVVSACVFLSCSDDSTTSSDPGNDTTAPEVALTASEQLVLTETELVLTAAATDNIGVAAVTFFDGSTELGGDSQAPFEHRINLTDAHNGMHFYKAVAEDAAGNSTSSEVDTVTVYINAQVALVNGGFDTGADGWDLHNFDQWSGWTDEAGNPPGCMRLNEYGTCEVDPGVSQVVTGLMPGVTFTISGEYRPYVDWIGNQFAKSFVVTIDSVVVGSFARSELGSEWAPFSASFVATRESHRIGFFAEYNCDDSSYELDNVQLTVGQ